MATNKNRGTSISRYNVVATYGSGKIGNARLYQHGERSYVRAAYNSSINNPRTDKQMKQRLLFASFGNLLSSLNSQGAVFSQNKTPYRSTVNVLRTVNRGLGAYFTKDQTLAKNVLLQPMRVSEGSLLTVSLEAIDYSMTSTPQVGQCNYSCWKSNLSLGNTDVYDNMAVSTVGEFATVLLANNPDLRPNDELLVCVFKQTGSVNDPSDFFTRPLRVSSVIDRYVLNVNDNTPFALGSSNRPVGNLVSCGIVQTAGTSATNSIFDFYLGWAKGTVGAHIQPALGNNCPNRTGVAIVIRRKSNGTQYSNSTIAANNETLINSLTSNQAFEAAKASYGVAETTSGNYVTVQANPINEGGEVDTTGGTLTGSGTFEMGSKVRITANPNTGYSASNLGMGLPSENTIVDSGTNYIEFIANKSCVIGAIFAE